MIGASSSFTPALVAGGLGVAALLLTPAAAHAIVYRAGPNVGIIPQTHIFEQGDPGTGRFAEGGYAASALGVNAFVFVQRFQYTPQPAPRAEIVVDDLIVSWVGEGPAPNTTRIRFGGVLTGSFTGGGGSGGASLSLGVFGSGVTNPGSASFFYSSLESAVVNDVLSIGREVAVDQPFTVNALLTVAALNLFGSFTTNFGDSFEFDPESVFELEPGFTINSASWGLVNNALPALLPTSTPAPAGLWLFLPALAGLGLVARRRR